MRHTGKRFREAIKETIREKRAAIKCKIDAKMAKEIEAKTHQAWYVSGKLVVSNHSYSSEVGVKKAIERLNQNHPGLNASPREIVVENKTEYQISFEAKNADKILKAKAQPPSAGSENYANFSAVTGAGNQNYAQFSAATAGTTGNYVNYSATTGATARPQDPPLVTLIEQIRQQEKSSNINSNIISKLMSDLSDLNLNHGPYKGVKEEDKMSKAIGKLEDFYKENHLANPKLSEVIGQVLLKNGKTEQDLKSLETPAQSTMPGRALHSSHQAALHNPAPPASPEAAKPSHYTKIGNK